MSEKIEIQIRRDIYNLTLDISLNPTPEEIRYVLGSYGVEPTEKSIKTFLEIIQSFKRAELV